MTRWIVLVGAVLAGCRHDNPNFCEDHPNNNCLADAADDGRCTTAADCTAPRAVCDVGATELCVQCTAASHDACTGTTPACIDHACQGCTAHAQCDSAACLPDGSCADPTQVAYVAPGGTGAACTKAAPCATLDLAVKTMRPTVKLATGKIEDAITTTIDRKVTILADAGARLDRSNDGVILEVKDTTADVAIFDLEITGATGDGNAAISLPNGGKPRLTLTRATVSRNQGPGILTATAASLTVTQSTFHDNDGGAVQMLLPATIVFTSNLVHHNGKDTSTTGGLALRPATASRVDFNTIVYNRSQAVTGSAAGVTCAALDFPVAFNIVYLNSGGKDGVEQAAGTCAFATSYFKPAALGANVPKFVQPEVAPFDYHLTAASPPEIVDAAGACSNLDLDGVVRPAGTACDLGAYELHR